MTSKTGLFLVQRRLLLGNLLVVAAFGLAGPAMAQDCYNSKILSPAPFLGNDGEIAKLADGSLWEVKYSYEYLYQYYPSIVICPGKGKLVINDKTLNVVKVGRSSGKQSGSAVIESTIANKFDGLNSGNIYRLANGQIWEQIEAWTWAWSWANPNVIIYPAPGGMKMKVENIEHSVLVKQIK